MEDKSLGEKIRDLRNQNGLTQEGLACKINVVRNTVSKWELNEAIPSTENLKELCTIFSVNIEYFLNDNINTQAQDMEAAEVIEIQDIETEIIVDNTDSKNDVEQVAATKPKKWLPLIICLSAIAAAFGFFGTIFGIIFFSSLQNSDNVQVIESDQTYDFSLSPLEGFIIFSVIFALLLAIIIFLIIKNRKKS